MARAGRMKERSAEHEEADWNQNCGSHDQVNERLRFCQGDHWAFAARSQA